VSKWVHSVELDAKRNGSRSLTKGEAETLQTIINFLDGDIGAGNSPSCAARLLRYWATFVSKFSAAMAHNSSVDTYSCTQYTDTWVWA
jgi:hypothetical protein